MTTLEDARSFLFVPGHRPELFSKAAMSGAHQIIFDLEDAVGASDKELARHHIVDWLSHNPGIVRVNQTDTPLFENDIHALRDLPDRAVVLPKADPLSLHAFAKLRPHTPVIALVESVDGLLSVDGLARHPSVRRIAFGNIDFAADARMPGTDAVLDQARFQISLHSRSANLPAPIDGVTLALDDAIQIAADVVRAKELGFGAKLCIHPRQIEHVNTGFRPSTADLVWARQIIAALDGSHGAAVQLGGKMVDRPMIARAEALLAAAELD